MLEEGPSNGFDDISDPDRAGDDAPANHRRTSRQAVVGIPMVAIAVGGLLIGGGLRVPSVAKPPREAVAGRQALRIPIDSSSAPLIREQEVDGQAEQPFSVSQDGRYLVYIGRPAAEAPAQLIVQRSINRTPQVSPARPAHAIRFFPRTASGSRTGPPTASGRGFCERGAIRSELWHSSGVSRGGTWLADNSIVVANTATASGLLQIPFDGGEPKVLTRPAPGELNHWYPSALPAGRGVLFTAIRSDRSEVWAGLLERAHEDPHQGRRGRYVR